MRSSPPQGRTLGIGRRGQGRIESRVIQDTERIQTFNAVQVELVMGDFKGTSGGFLLLGRKIDFRNRAFRILQLTVLDNRLKEEVIASLPVEVYASRTRWPV